MAQIDILNLKGEKVGELEIREDVFNIEPNTDVMFRYVDMQLTNRRAGTASTKTRGEVSGGGRKPWSQKHTGRARAGSIRAPHWKGGGVAHGPKPKIWNKKLPKKVKKLALKSALSVKFREKNLIVLEDLRFDKPKAREMRDVLKGLGLDNTYSLFVLPKKEDAYVNVKLSGRNFPNVKVIIADNPNNGTPGIVKIDGLNVYDIIRHEKLVLTVDMVKKIEEVLGG
ncbi:MAG: large subunit ribosomal protein [Thermotogaceae bacterium]|jgi:large subunit ribosomal protein L4|nr:large subunit ribosomal protein [Thermotogaceae bacterium]MDN5337397.1 large subunit ribosomal protein [Thermotogaceae bacterium]